MRRDFGLGSGAMTFVCRTLLKSVGTAGASAQKATSATNAEAMSKVFIDLSSDALMR